ncbi:hypothetical protein ACOMHN_059815 [Nucella lapillus]
MSADAWLRCQGGSGQDRSLEPFVCLSTGGALENSRMTTLTVTTLTVTTLTVTTLTVTTLTVTTLTVTTLTVTTLTVTTLTVTTLTVTTPTAYSEEQQKVTILTEEQQPQLLQADCSGEPAVDPVQLMLI